MGNAAVVRAKGNKTKSVYLHWNGGRPSIEAFLKYCELRNFRVFEDSYGMAGFVQVVSNFFGGGISVGIEDGASSFGGNGVYVVEGWEIVGREDILGEEVSDTTLEERLIEIDRAQPINQRLGEFITAKEVNVTDIKIGDIVFVEGVNSTSNYKKYKVVGIGEDEIINGTNVKGMPYVNYIEGEKEDDYKGNINNYLRSKTVKRSRL